MDRTTLTRDLKPLEKRGLLTTRHGEDRRTRILELTPEGEAGTLRDQAIKRRIYPREFAQMALFLAADDGAACTAQQFLVDGGRF